MKAGVVVVPPNYPKATEEGTFMKLFVSIARAAFNFFLVLLRNCRIPAN
jgi:hypothetical protein